MILTRLDAMVLFIDWRVIFDAGQRAVATPRFPMAMY
jgi:hypothetical protein